MLVHSAATSGDRLAALVAMRDRLAQAIDDCESMRELPALTRQLTDVLRQIEEVEAATRKTGGVSTPLDELNKRRTARAANAEGAGGPRVAGKRRG